MKLNTVRRTSGIAAVAFTLSLTLAACGSEEEPTGSEPTSSETPAEETPEETPTEESEATNAGAETFGPGCSAVPTSGAGSFDGMVQDPVATAASNNPLLGTLVTAVTEAGLVDTLNDAEALTVFAPTDDAFAKIPEADLKAVLADKELLTTILTGHVIGEQLGTDQIAGTHETLAGDMVEVKGSGEEFTVGEENAAILCGNIPTANATVYVIDTVMMPMPS